MFHAHLKKVLFLFGIAEVLKKKDTEKQEAVGSAAVNPIFVQVCKVMCDML